jgi:diguanylate cyclase (GGDEF)-like protein
VRGIASLLAAENIHGLLLVCAYRGDELDAVHPLSKLLQDVRRRHPPRHLPLGNLPLEGLATLLAEMLRLGPADAVRLAEAVGPRSGGNPFDTIELLNALRSDGVLRLTDSGWGWDATTIRRFVSQGEVVDLLAARIARLPRTAQELVDVMACLGAEVASDLLQAASGVSATTLEDQIAPSLEEGLLVREQGDQKSSSRMLRFRHDRVQQAAYGRLGPAQRQILHLAIARRLSAQPEFRAAQAEQYMPAIDLISDANEGGEVVILLHEAALAARRLINYSAMERFLAAALRLLHRIAVVASDPRFTALEIDRHTALYSLGCLDEADTVFRSMAERGLDPVILAATAAIQINSLTNRGRMPEALALGLAILGELGLIRPGGNDRPDVVGQLDRLRRWITEDARAFDHERRECDDRRTAAAAGLINRLMPSVAMCDMEAMLWLLLEGQRLWNQYGPDAALVGALSYACVVAITLGQDYRCGYDIARHVVAIGAARRYQPETSQARVLSAITTRHWFEPLEDSLAEMQRLREELVGRGDLQVASWTYAASIAILLDFSSSLESCEEEIDAALAFVTRTGNQYGVDIFLGYRQLPQALRRGAGAPGGGGGGILFDDATPSASLSANPLALGYYHIYRALAAAVFDDGDRLIVHAAAAMPLLPYFCTLYPNGSAYLLQALALARRVKAAALEQRGPLLAQFDACRDWMAGRAAEAPVNFRHLLHWIDAERAWAAGDLWNAISAFDRALRDSEPRQRPWHKALISERAGLFHLEQGLESAGRDLLARARYLYEVWGAVAKVQKMMEGYPILCDVALRRRKDDRTRSSSSGVSSDSIDLRGILRASQALSSETSFARLLARVGEVLQGLSGATRILTVVWDDVARGWILPGDEPMLSIPLEEAGERGLLPLSVFHYLKRTEELLLVEEVPHDDRFARDAYFTGIDHCSLLGVPILTKGVLRAMLLLENRLSRGAFSADRLEAVMLVSGQLGVSLDNVQLYDSLERKVAERTNSMNEANQRLETLSATDPLTGLANRRRFNDMIGTEWRRAIRPQSWVGAAMIDIDQFKLYNDHYGHQGGDECLRRVAHTLSESVRASGGDLVARYGGEEFVIVLPGADLATVYPVAERARAAVEALNEPHAVSTKGIVTISIGIASLIPTEDNSAEAVIELADAALYQAKRNGRNQVGSS